ncbi:glycyl-radical enzyme activating protein [Moorella sp. ACPs]|jgi:pyruvate formate lyase activating enzyme|uniref:glycyl-radical enzyme activating protein n=1 Tax=Neomoorella carbonis TaxID=3062783 RepID=UPI00324AC90A
MPVGTETGVIFDIERNALVDGPGIRTVVFLKGCPLRCKWCHNPESQEPGPQLMYTKAFCVGCGECVVNCPEGAIIASQDGLKVNKELCNLCGECIRVCFAKAWSVVGENYTVEEVIQQVKKSASFFRFSGGGVTISGGEPFFQFDFLLSLLKSLRAEGYHVAVDTSGYTSPERLEEVAKYTDLFLYDLKHYDSQQHVRLTGVDNKIILENARRLSFLGKKVIIRVPVIPGMNDTDDNLKRIALFTSQLPGVSDVELLPFTKLGASKYQRLQIDNPCEGISPPSENRMKELAAYFAAVGLNVAIGG